MDCPQCGARNENTASLCCQCGLDLDQYLGRRQTPEAKVARPMGPKAPSTLIGSRPSPPPGFLEYDPARRPAQPRPVSQFVPPPNFPNYRGWAITVLVLCLPPMGVVALFYHGWAIALPLLCCLPTGIIALTFSLLVDAGLARGESRKAWRQSQQAKLWCWVSSAVVIAVYVGLFYWLLAWVRGLWPY
jgi:hypothetical protein